MVGQLHRLHSRVPLVRPPVQAGPALRDGPVKEALGQGRKHVVVDGGAACAHAEQSDGSGVPAVVDDVLLNPSAVRNIKSLLWQFYYVQGDSSARGPGLG